MSSEGKKADLLYLRAKAQNMLKEYGAALATIDKVLSETSFDDQHCEFLSELLRFRFSLLQKLRPRGDRSRIESAQDIANHARQYELQADWAYGEGMLLQEHLFASSFDPQAIGEDEIGRAERALAQISSGPDQVRMQCILVGAYTTSVVSSFDEDDLTRAVALLEEIFSVAPRSDALVAISNILLSWIRLATVDGSSLQLLNEIKKTTDLGLRILAESIDGSGEPATAEVIHLRSEADAICRTATLCIRFLDAEASPDVARRLQTAKDLDEWAGYFAQLQSESLNRNWIVASILQSAAHLRMSVGLLAEAEASYRLALKSIDTTAVRNSLKGIIAENLYAVLCATRPADAFYEIVKTDTPAASWTATVEQDKSVFSPLTPILARAALAGFERRCLVEAEKAGRLSRVGATAEGNAKEIQKEPDERLETGLLPKLDSVAFPISVSRRLSSTAATVVLCSGRSSGYALIVPPNAQVREAVSINLPDYCSRVADEIALSRKEGWVSALLEWRSNRDTVRFDAAIRRTSVKLWETVIGRVKEAIDDMGCASVDLAVRRDQRLLPWGCSAPHSDLGHVFADSVKLSTGYDLGTLLLGHLRADRRDLAKSEPNQNTQLAATAKARSGITDDPRWSSHLEVLSITDGTGDLPMTRLEGDIAREVFPDATHVIEGGLEPQDASKLFDLMGTANVIHIASHGVWMPTHPWVSSLMLGPTFALYAASVRARVILNGSLVVLSACESGMGGPAAAGEGGLVQAFLLAGARSVVASSWMVHDLSSLVFGKLFFEALAANNDLFTATKFARQSMKKMTREEFSNLVERWSNLRPEISSALQRGAEQFVTAGTLPFSSPVHWGAQFLATS